MFKQQWLVVEEAVLPEVMSSLDLPTRRNQTTKHRDLEARSIQSHRKGRGAMAAKMQAEVAP